MAPPGGRGERLDRDERAENDRAPLPTHHLHPSNLFVPKEPHVIVTVLGTCIAVCLWDPRAGIGGMNHYMLPLWNGVGLATPKYGNIAIRKLIEQVEDLGSKRIDIVAKVFGGKSKDADDTSHFNIGARNIEIAMEMLRDARIEVVAQNCGGNFARKIYFDTSSGEVRLKRQLG